MNRLVTLFVLLFATSAFAGDRIIYNPDVNGDVKIKVNKAGTPTDVITVTGTTGKVTANQGLEVRGAESNFEYLTADGIRFQTLSDGSSVINMHGTKTSNPAMSMFATIPAASDTGSNHVFRFDARTNAGGSIANRPIFSIQNNATPRVTVAADGVTTFANGIAGTTTNNNACTGCVGEYVGANTSSIFTQSSPTAGTYYDVPTMSITLDPGDWDLWLDGDVAGQWLSGSATCSVLGAIRTSGNTLVRAAVAGLFGDPTNTLGPSKITTGHVHIRQRISISAQTTYKYSIRYVNWSGTCTVNNIENRGDISASLIAARRIR